jgi:hypothetical protein
LHVGLKLFVLQSAKLKFKNPDPSLLFYIINKFYTVSFLGFIIAARGLKVFKILILLEIIFKTHLLLFCGCDWRDAL